jgi:hypothetical protein
MLRFVQCSSDFSIRTGLRQRAGRAASRYRPSIKLDFAHLNNRIFGRFSASSNCPNDFSNDLRLGSLPKSCG